MGPTYDEIEPELARQRVGKQTVEPAQMTTPNTMTAAKPRVVKVRGAVAGLLAAFGALVAHAFAGGSVEVVPGLVVLLVALPLATVLTRADSVDVPRLAATAVAAQVVGHLCLMMTPSEGAAHAHHLAGAAGPSSASNAATLDMLALHAAVALGTVAIAAGLDRALLDVVRAFVGWLLPLRGGQVALPVLHRCRAERRAAPLLSLVWAGGGWARAPPSVGVLPLHLHCTAR